MLSKRNLSGLVGILWIIERLIGLAGLPDDLQAIVGTIVMIPDWIGGPVFGIFLVLMWQSGWAGRQRERARKIFRRARVKIKIGASEYIPFTNLVDVINEIDMKPLGPNGERYGTLPEGTNLICFLDGSVRLAMPLKAEFAETITLKESFEIILTKPDGTTETRSSDD